METTGGFRRPRWFARIGLAGLLGLSGCAQVAPTALVPGPPRAAAPLPGRRETARIPTPIVQTAAATLQDPEALDAPSPAEVKALPISLDTVLRLGQDQNGKVALAREQLHEAFAGQDLAAKRWLPDLFLGTSYYRHEGG